MSVDFFIVDEGNQESLLQKHLEIFIPQNNSKAFLFLNCVFVSETMFPGLSNFEIMARN